MEKFRTVGLVARSGNEPVMESVRLVRDYLESQHVDVLVGETAAGILADPDPANIRRMGTECDLIIAVGGDGNMLGTARTFASYGVPIVGVNRGRLGFLADISPEDLETSLGAVLSGDYTVEKHFLLEGEVSIKGVPAVPCALNEVLLHSAEMPHMIEFELSIDGAFVYSQRSDGLILASPTGSTAYALSAGGPIMHPSLDAVVLVPMFPHTLTSRPLVVPGNSKIEIKVAEHIDTNAKVSFDSQLEFEIEPGQSLTVRKMKHELKLVHPPGHSFYQVCRSKLDWASRVG